MLAGRIQPGVLGLSLRIAGTCGLAQQLVADTPVAGIAAVTTKHLPQTTLGDHHPLPRGLLEQASSQVFDAVLFAQARAVEQPQGDLQGKTLGCGRR